MLLEELLREVLEVPLRKRRAALGRDGDLRAVLGDFDGVAQGSGLAPDLDAVGEVLLEGGELQNLVVDGLGAVDHEARGLLGGLLASASERRGHRL